MENRKTMWWRGAGRGVRMAGAVRVATAIAVLAMGCGSGPEADEERRGEARGAPPENHATTIPADSQHRPIASPTDSTPCPPTGQWAPCHVVKRLEQAGLRADTSHDRVTRKPLTRDGIRMSVRRATLELYFYPDRAARERDQARLDRSRFLAADQDPGPRHMPTLVTSENLLVVMDTRNERQRERITLAITAGPPQPAAP